MDNNSQNPVQKIKQAEAEGQRIILLAREKAKKDLTEAVQRKDYELRKRTEETQKKVDKYLQSLQKKIDKQAAEEKIKIAAQVDKIGKKLQAKTRQAIGFITKKLISE